MFYAHYSTLDTNAGRSLVQRIPALLICFCQRKSPTKSRLLELVLFPPTNQNNDNILIISRTALHILVCSVQSTNNDKYILRQYSVASVQFYMALVCSIQSTNNDKYILFQYSVASVQFYMAWVSSVQSTNNDKYILFQYSVASVQFYMALVERNVSETPTKKKKKKKKRSTGGQLTLINCVLRSMCIFILI